MAAIPTIEKVVIPSGEEVTLPIRNLDDFEKGIQPKYYTEQDLFEIAYAAKLVLYETAPDLRDAHPGYIAQTLHDATRVDFSICALTALSK